MSQKRRSTAAHPEPVLPRTPHLAEIETQDQEAASGGGLVDQDAQGAEELREVLHLVDDHESA